MKDEKKFAIEAATKAGKYIKERVGNFERIDYKSAFNLVTEVDQASEKLILQLLHEAFPADTVLAEESGGSKQSVGRRWLIDPLDGTTNFAHSYPYFCVSIGLEIDGELAVGVVYNPLADELFTAEGGQGAFLNDKRISVSTVPSLDKSLLATGFPPDSGITKNNNLDAFIHMTNLTHGVRRGGSAALDLCCVASGRLDGFWEYKLGAWDIGAGTLIVREAGGKVTDPTGGALDINSGHILATNGQVHDELMHELDKFCTAKK